MYSFLREFSFQEDHLHSSHTLYYPLNDREYLGTLPKNSLGAHYLDFVIREGLTADGLDKGSYFAPTVLSEITAEMLIYREETFGPVAAIVPYDDDDDVIQMANDTNYGLAAYVYTTQLARAMRLFEALNFGIIGINDINPTAAAAPFGGVKQSGLGREGGREGIEEYLDVKLGGFAI